MAEIHTSSEDLILVDDQDVHLLAGYEWHVTNDGYAATNVPHPLVPELTTLLLMHRVIMGLCFGDPTFVDHINGCGIDNRRHNLRSCTNSENQRNRGIQKNNTSGYKGVVLNKRTGTWQAAIRHEGVRINLGTFENAEEAAHSYNKAAIKFFGEFAVLNPVEGIFITEKPKKRNVNAKLSDEAVLLIRSSAQPARILAEQFGVDRRTIDRVRAGVHYTTSDMYF